MDVYKILIADASPEILSDIGRVINKYHSQYETIFASDSKKLCRLASINNPDLIILDMMLPSLGGDRTIAILKRLKHTRNIPVVMLTPADLLAHAYQTGADDYLYKPFTEPELLFRVRFALRLSANMKKAILQNQLLQKQAEEMLRQNRMLEEQRKDIIDDITYSRRIQNAIMPSRETLKALFPQHFLYFKPKRIVSGDFYWVSLKLDKAIIAIADCTGHGISGAFLTIAGTAYLNEIINYFQPDAGEILNQLRMRIMRLLHQKGVEGEASDGMDITLCVLDLNEHTLQYAGANNPTYIVKTDGSLLICAADRMPIGIHENFDKPFRNTNLVLEKGDMVYMFTDGYADQFGGENDQKFRNKNLKQLFTSIHKLEVAEQCNIMEKTMDEWIGYRDQIDDMLIIGIRI